MTEPAISLTSLSLKRYPPQAKSSPLQAWDSADDYVLTNVDWSTIATQPLLIINDSFGALTCALYRYHPYFVTDSLLSQLACRQNLRHNGLSQESVHFLTPLTPLPTSPGLVIIKIPKMLSLLKSQLIQLRQVISPHTQIVAAGKVQDIHTSTLRLFEQIIGPSKTSLARKKSRLIFSQMALDLPQPPAVDMVSWSLPGTTYQIDNYANVFSQTSLDIGARFFIEHLPQDLTGNIVDLGCGNGVIGLMALQYNPQAHLVFIDESYLAVASSQRNITHNRPHDLARCLFQVNDCLTGIAADSLQAVLCNPPFHQQKVLTDHIARQMFQDAKRCLQRDGELRIIGNRHLNYYSLLKRLFGNCQTVAANHKFVVLRSIKQ